MTHTAAPLLLTTTEAARLLGLGRSSVYKLAADGRLSLVKIGKSSRVTRDSVESLVAELIAEGRPQDESPGGEPGLPSKDE